MESSGRGRVGPQAGPPEIPVVLAWPEAPTMAAYPRTVLTPVPEGGVPASAAVTDLAGAVVAGGVALLLTAETGRRVGAPPPVTLVCAVASFAAVVGPRLGRFRAYGPVRDGWGSMG